MWFFWYYFYSAKYLLILFKSCHLGQDQDFLPKKIRQTQKKKKKSIRNQYVLGPKWLLLNSQAEQLCFLTITFCQPCGWNNKGDIISIPYLFGSSSWVEKTEECKYLLLNFFSEECWTFLYVFGIISHKFNFS